jgi:hypothetical protein
MRLQWLVPCFLLPLACSNPPASAETATLVLRCHDGRVSAYMVPVNPEQIAAGDLPADAVEVQLEAAPDCDE